MGWEFAIIHLAVFLFFNNLNRLDFSALIKKKSTKGDFTYIFQKYLEDVKTYFGAEPQSVNFIGASDQIRKEINSWVEKQTEGKLSARWSPVYFWKVLLYHFELCYVLSMYIS